MDIQAYENRQKDIYDNKVKHGFNTSDPYQEVRYIVEEVGELMRAIEKNDMNNVAEELADIVIFSYGLAEITKAGNLDAKIFEKMQINVKRKYTQNESGDFIKVKDEQGETQIDIKKSNIHNDSDNIVKV